MEDFKEGEAVIMGIYYFAVDYGNKKQMWPPTKFSIKSPSIYHCHNPFPNMVIMKNSQGYDFKIVNDVSTTYEHEFEDVTKETYEELKNEWPDYDWDKAEWREGKNNEK